MKRGFLGFTTIQAIICLLKRTDQAVKGGLLLVKIYIDLSNPIDNCTKSEKILWRDFCCPERKQRYSKSLRFS